MWVMKTTPYYGDNLDILREYIPYESVGLVYLDPPFKSSQDYNIRSKKEMGPSLLLRLGHFGIRGY